MQMRVALLRSFCLFCVSLVQHGWAQVRVMAPESLVNALTATRGRIDGSTSTFGAPFYGERILGRLVWGDSLNNHSHCKDDDYVVPPPDEIPKQGSTYESVRLIHIILVRRGKCSFVTKVRIARAKGAHAVIIVDKEDSKLTVHDIRRVIVADDGYGGSIDIPSMLITKEEGQLLINAAKQSQVIIELAWDVPTNHVVLVDLWMSSASRESMRFLQDFSAKRKALNDAIKFVPHYHVFGMQSTTDYNNLCSDVTAQYCAEDPDGSGPISGKMALEEDVRQLCIHELTKVARTDFDRPFASDDKGTSGMAANTVEYAAKYWDYIEKMLEACPLDADTEAKRFGKECSERLMQTVGIDVAKVNQCISSTADAKLKQQRTDAAWSPRALRINGWRYSGTLDADLVTRAICAGFVKQPAACTDLVEPVNPFHDMKKPQDGVGLSTFVIALVVVAAFTCGGLLFYKRSMTKNIHHALREEVMLEVQAQMDTYRQMG